MHWQHEHADLFDDDPHGPQSLDEPPDHRELLGVPDSPDPDMDPAHLARFVPRPC